MQKMSEGKSVDSAPKAMLIGLSKCHPWIDHHVGKNCDVCQAAFGEVIAHDRQGQLELLSDTSILESLEPPSKACTGAGMLCFNCHGRRMSGQTAAKICTKKIVH